MKWKECKSLISSDLSRLAYINKWGGVKNLLFNASFRITFWFRIGSYLITKHHIIAKLCLIFVQLIHKHNQYLTGIQIGFGTKIGKALMFPHYSCIVINGAAIIGDNCTIYHGVTIGSVRGPKGGVPRIGNNVVIASGAKVIGNVTVGNNVMIGSGSIVITDIPDNSVVVGIPGKVISKEGLEHTKYYSKNYDS